MVEGVSEVSGGSDVDGTGDDDGGWLEVIETIVVDTGSVSLVE